MSLLLIGIAGGVGTLLRYALAVWTVDVFGTALPYGTLAVNVVGSFVLGIVVEACSGVAIAGTDARLVLGIGLLGGFTTYSSFNMEVLRLFEQAAFVRGCGYLLGTMLGCLGAGVLGLAVGRLLVTASAAP